MKFRSNTNYAFLNTLIRVKESRMLTAGEVERMIDAKDATESYKVLNDLDYADFLGESDRPEDFQTIINAGLVEVKNLVEKNAPYKEIPHIIWTKFDFHNLKVLVKAKLQEKEISKVEPMLSQLGEFTITELQELIQKGELGIKGYSSKPTKQQIMIDAVGVAIANYQSTEDPILVDAAIDYAYFSYLNQEVQELKNEFLSKYFQLIVDLNNIQMYLRALLIQKKDFFNHLFVEGGSLNQNFFKGEISEFKERLDLTIYGSKLASGMKAYQEENNFTQLEKSADKMVLDHMIKARYITFGPEPMFAFFWIKENNAQIIRTIMVNKLNGIEPSKIRTKIKKLYQ